MPTPKPGQIRCPTCHQPTPMAAFCTQCGAAIPPGAQARPRGMDRQELDERIRQRRPGEGRLRRGTPAEGGDVPPAGYVPFEPAPEDAQAVREPAEAPAHVDNLPPGYEGPPQPEPVPPSYDPRYAPRHEAPPAEPQPPEDAEPYADEGYEDYAPYGAPEDAYPYPEQFAGEPHGGGAGMLPVIGFAALALLALGVGAALAGIFGGGGTAAASPTPTATNSAVASVEPSAEATASEAEASPTPGPTDGPVIFPDGAQLSIQPCGSSGFDDGAIGHPEEDACLVDSSGIEDGEAWALVVFADASGSDTLTIKLMENDQVQDEQESTIDEALGGDCGASCNGLIYGAHYVGLFSGDYELILLRNGEFADSATFTVE